MAARSAGAGKCLPGSTRGPLSPSPRSRGWEVAPGSCPTTVRPHDTTLPRPIFSHVQPLLPQCRSGTGVCPAPQPTCLRVARAWAGDRGSAGLTHPHPRTSTSAFPWRSSRESLPHSLFLSPSSLPPSLSPSSLSLPRSLPPPPISLSITHARMCVCVCVCVCVCL